MTEDTFYGSVKQFDALRREPYEKPEANIIDLGNMMDEAVGILQDSGRKIDALKKRAESMLAEIENMQALQVDAATEIDKAESLMVKVQRILEAANEHADSR